MSNQERLLQLWKARQQAEGHDVSGVMTLDEASHFFDPKDELKPESKPKQKKAKVK